MSAARFPPLPPGRRQQRSDTQFVPGSQRGLVANASPVGGAAGRDRARAQATPSGGGSGGTQFKWDRFPITVTGAQTKALTYLPSKDSLHLKLNGIDLDEGPDYTLSGQTVSLLAAADLRVGQVLWAKYAYLGVVPVTPTSPATSTPTAGRTGLGGVLNNEPTNAGDLVVVFLSTPSTVTVATLNGYTHHGTTAPVTHLATSGTYTYHMHVLSKIVTGQFDVPVASVTNNGNTFCIMRYAGGGAVTGVSLTTVADGLSASTPASPGAAQTCRCWTTISAGTMGAAASGTQRAFSNRTDIDQLMTTDPSAADVSTTNSTAAGWLLATVAVS